MALLTALRIIEEEAAKRVQRRALAMISDQVFPSPEQRSEDNKAILRYAHLGIDTRTYIATRIMAGIAASPILAEGGAAEAAESAVVWADALIQRLNRGY